MNKILSLSLTSIAVLGLTSCAYFNSQPANQPRMHGASTTTAVAEPGQAEMRAGATGAFGGELGKNMDSIDRAKMNQCLETAKTNQSISWSHGEKSITCTPTRTFVGTDKTQPCRDFTIRSNFGGKSGQNFATACRTGSERWNIVSS